MRPLIALYFDSVRKANIQSEEDIFFFSTVLECMAEDTENRTGLYRIPFSMLMGKEVSAGPIRQDDESVFELWIQKLFCLNCDSDDGSIRIASKFFPSVYVDRKAKILGVQAATDLFQADMKLRKEDYKEWSDLSPLQEYNDNDSSKEQNVAADAADTCMYRALLTFLAEAKKA